MNSQSAMPAFDKRMKTLLDLPLFTNDDVEEFREELVQLLDVYETNQGIEKLLEEFEERAHYLNSLRQAQQDPDLVTHELMNNFHLRFYGADFWIKYPEYVLKAVEEAVAATGISYKETLERYEAIQAQKLQCQGDRSALIAESWQISTELDDILIVAFRWIRRNRPDITWKELTS